MGFRIERHGDELLVRIEGATRGEQDVARLEAAINKFSAAAEKSSTKSKGAKSTVP